jgi:hypothetical protein
MRRPRVREWLLGLACCLAACGGSTPTHATALAVPEETLARWPGCTLDDWTLDLVPEPFTPPPWTWCGVTYCTGPVRGYTNTTQKRIRVWAGDPHAAEVLAWEACNACRWEATRELRDVGCA